MWPISKGETCFSRKAVDFITTKVSPVPLRVSSDVASCLPTLLSYLSEADDH